MESRIVKVANIPNGCGWAIGLLLTSAYGGYAYQVVRMDPQSRYVVLSNHADEGEARKAANAEYKADKAALARRAPFASE